MTENNIITSNALFTYFYAIARDNIIAVTILIENNIDVNQTLAENGMTPLIFAVMNNRYKIIDALLKGGADIDKKDNEGKSAMDYAVGKKEILQVIDNYLAGTVCVDNPPHPLFLLRGIEAENIPRNITVASRVFKQVSRSIVYITSGKSAGSGVFIQPHIIATNCHVVKNDIHNIRVYASFDGVTTRKEAFHAVTPIKYDHTNDLCLLYINSMEGTFSNIRKYNTIKIGENVYVLGSPDNQDLTLTTGIISQLRKYNNGVRFIQTNAAVSPGSSGGGMFDCEGNLMGIITQKNMKKGVDGIGMAIPAEIVL